MYHYVKLAIALLMLCLPAKAQLTPYEKGNYNTTATYEEITTFYKNITTKTNQIKVQNIGTTDGGAPLQLVTISSNGKHDAAQWNKQNKTVILINNGIHPGEPDGIDACMLLTRNIANGTIKLPSNVCLAIIPVYNIGGCLNRSSNYRVDQNGPEEFGFRGNAQNLDLNRDFIKCDSRDARTFAQIFHMVKPQILIDNHVSNGADYQHIMTLIATQHNKLGGAVGAYQQDSMTPAIYESMKLKGIDVVPYVNFFGATPLQGWTEFYDSPRYSTGYSTLWHCFGYVPETHMLKPYKLRVAATYELMLSFITYASTNHIRINALQKEAQLQYQIKSTVPLDWEVSKQDSSMITFKGYTSSYKPSLVTGLPRLYYDRASPFTKKIPFYNTYLPTIQVTKPKAYIIPKGWWKVIELLQLNKVLMSRLKQDTIITVEAYTITDYKSGSKPYENHHANSNIKVSSSIQTKTFAKGDYIIYLQQNADRYIVETLEPQGRDSYMAWNFFDGILGQKEGYSDYVFEETALKILAEKMELKLKFLDKKIVDKAFAQDAEAQLNYIYKNSKYFEPAYMQYPVYRVLY